MDHPERAGAAAAHHHNRRGDQDDRGEAGEADHVHDDGTVLAARRVVVEAVEEDRVDRSADLSGRGLDEAEAEVARRVLDAVEVAGEPALGRRDDDGARVGELDRGPRRSGSGTRRPSSARPTEAASPVRKCQPCAAAGCLYRERYASFFAAAIAGVSRGSKLTATTSKSFPASSDITFSDATRPLRTCVQSIGQL